MILLGLIKSKMLKLPLKKQTKSIQNKKGKSKGKKSKIKEKIKMQNTCRNKVQSLLRNKT